MEQVTKQVRLCVFHEEQCQCVKGTVLFFSARIDEKVLEPCVNYSA